MAYNSNQLLVAVKAYSRGNALPLDASEVYGSLAEAQSYASSPTAYAGQTIKALLEDGKYHSYIIQPDGEGYTLEEVGAVSSSDLKQYVQVVDALPESAQEQGVLYINATDSTGSIWTGAAWKEVFRDVQARVTTLEEQVGTLEETVASKAPVNDPVFTGTVTLPADPTTDLGAATKQYVDRLIGNIVSSAPGVVSSTESIPQTGYKAGQTWRVAEAGTYVGQACETGDLIICIADCGSAYADGDFIVVQANIDGAVTGGDASTDGNIVVYDGTSGKVIKDSEVSIASLNAAIANSHTHENKTVLDTYTRTQTELLEDAQGQVDAAVSTLNEAISGKADKATTLAGYGITDAYTKTETDGKLDTITQNLNTKLDGTAVDEKIAAAKTDILSEASSDAAAKIEARVGDIPAESTLKSYIDSVAGTGSADVGATIEQAKSDAIQTSKDYTDAALTITEF